MRDSELFQRLETRFQRDIAPRAGRLLQRGSALLVAVRERDFVQEIRRGQRWVASQAAAAELALRELITWWELLVSRYFALLQLRTGVTAVQHALPF